MNKILIAFMILSLNVFAGDTDAKYTIARINLEDSGSMKVGFVESAPYYHADVKFKDCIQEAAKKKLKVDIKYDFKTFVIKSCQVMK